MGVLLEKILDQKTKANGLRTGYNSRRTREVSQKRQDRKRGVLGRTRGKAMTETSRVGCEGIVKNHDVIVREGWGFKNSLGNLSQGSDPKRVILRMGFSASRRPWIYVLEKASVAGISWCEMRAGKC